MDTVNVEFIGYRVVCYHPTLMDVTPPLSWRRSWATAHTRNLGAGLVWTRDAVLTSDITQPHQHHAATDVATFVGYRPHPQPWRRAGVDA